MNYHKLYNQIIERGKSRILDGYKERHHIIPRCIGGTDELDNIVELTAKEHFICHKLLTEIYPNENKLHYAIWMMTTMSDIMERDYKIGSREYHRLRESLTVSDETREKMRNSHLGKTHSSKTLEKMRKPKPAEFGKNVSERLKGVPKSLTHIKNMAKSYRKYYENNDSWSKGITNRWTSNQIKHNRDNQPTVRKVDQYSIDGKFIKTWDSITETKKICSGVPQCLMGIQSTSGGFIWKYSDNNPPNKRKGGKQKTK